MVVIYLGHVLDVQGKQKEEQVTRVIAGFCVIYAVMNVIVGFGNDIRVVRRVFTIHYS